MPSGHNRHSEFILDDSSLQYIPSTALKQELAADGTPMYIAMNRFKVAKGSEKNFEDLWMNRESSLHELSGFIAFHLLKGPQRDDHVLYSSHTVWRSFTDFENWTKSEQFRKAHANAGNSAIRPLYLGHPEFEGFEVLQEILPDGTKKSAAA
jgi:heme-degrading monooxygenase HmoA